MTEVLTAAPVSCEVLAARWLEAEERSEIEPMNATLAQEAIRLAAAYEDAIRAASQEELRLAWEAARQRQGRELIGTREWSDARRVSELLRTEYAAARPTPEDAKRD